MPAKRPLTEDEIKNLLQSFEGKLHNRNIAILALGLATGFRIKELLSLRIKDIYNIDGDKFLQDIYVQKSNMKKNVSRPPVRYSQKIIPYLKNWIDQMMEVGCLPESPLFRSNKPNEDGTERPIIVRSAIRIFKEAYESCGILDNNVGTHSCRKTYAKKCYEATGKDLLKTQKLMGHKNIDSTTKYLVTCDSELNDISQGLNVI